MKYAHPHTTAIKAFEEKATNSRKVMCDGGTGDSGHPRVFLKMEENENSITCPYCSVTFIYKAS
jgi:uncharacterized Zn-finger protein